MTALALFGAFMAVVVFLTLATIVNDTVEDAIRRRQGRA